MVIGKLTSYLALGLIGAFLINALVRPAHAIGTAGALQETGVGIASIGSGIGESLSSLGEGGANLLRPLWEIKNLLFDANVSGSASVGPVSQQQGTTNVVTGSTNPSTSTVTWNSGTTATLPTLSPAAKSWYESVGVQVS